MFCKEDTFSEKAEDKKSGRVFKWLLNLTDEDTRNYEACNYYKRGCHG